MKHLLRLTILCLFAFSMVGCLGQRQEQEQKKRAAQQRVLKRLDASGRRVVFRDQHGDTLGKWRLRRDHLKVYDEKLRPQGRVRIVRDKEGQFTQVEGLRHDGTLMTIAPVNPGELTRYRFGERLMIERQGKQWVLGQLDPFVILARITPNATMLRVQETRRNKNPVVRHVTSDPDHPTQSQVQTEQGDVLWRAPLKVSRAQLAPFALTHSSISPMERGMLAMFLDATQPSPVEPAKEP